MDVEAVEVFTSVLTLAAAALAVTVLAGRLLRTRSRVVDNGMVAIDDAALWLAWLIAAVAMAGSLYFSESAGFVPCRWCWFQRVAMYPLAVILLVAAVRRDRSVRWYVVPVAAVGACISAYHYAIEWRPSLEVGSCAAFGPSCADVYFRRFGFVTLSFMALCGFISIIVLVTAVAAATTGWTDTLEPNEGGERPRDNRLES